MTDKDRQTLIHNIARRGVQMCNEAGVKYPLLDAHMDIDYADRDVGMDLQKFLDFDDHNFLHDLAGIRNHMDRRTYRLTDCFVPRCAA